MKVKTVEQWFSEYAVSHQHPSNKTIHWIMVPAIYFSFVGLLWSLPLTGINSDTHNSFPWLNAASLLALPVHWFYVRLSKPLALAMMLFTIFCFLLCELLISISPLPLWQLSLSIFIIAWLGQYIGHKIEGKKPSFFEDIQYLLIGPLWLMGFVFNYLGLEYSPKK
ncbi:Mpo1 family 2-hydroxy fatty acid dioxygenase [Agarivorans sp. MS3-6]